MVSLTAVEESINRLWPDHSHAVIQIPDARKGEQLILITTRQLADRSEIITYFNQNGLGELGIPKNILHLDKLPLLATGKTDYVTLREWLLQQQSKNPDNNGEI